MQEAYIEAEEAEDSEVEPAQADASGYGGYNSYGGGSYNSYGGYGGYGGHSHNTTGVHRKGRPCEFCCPNTTTTREETAQLTANSLLQPVTVNASCPLSPNTTTDPGYNVDCHKATTPTLQYGGTCEVECTNPLDYLLVTPTAQTHQFGCSDDGVQTSCTYVASNIVTAGGGTQRFVGPCTIRATAACCKQVCRQHFPHPRPPEKKHQEPPPAHHYYKQGGYTDQKGPRFASLIGRHRRRRRRQ